MFGYVKIGKAELRVKEYEYYRATYCGLCRSMGKCTGQCSRLTLSYDVAFLAQVRMLFLGTEPTFRARRCLVHPFRRRMMMELNESLCYAADVSALLAFEKCRDDVADSRFFGRLKARFRCLFLRGAYRRAKRRLPELATLFRRKLTELSALEARRERTVDKPAALFGEMLSAAMSHGMEGTTARVAAIIGEKVGRFIYIVDAIDDLVEDEKNGNYNPVLLLYGKQPEEAERKALYEALISSLDDISAALDLTEETVLPTRRAVIENILYIGMPATARRVLFGEEACHKEETDEQPL